MSNHDDHCWDLSKSNNGNLRDSDGAFEQKFEQWRTRNWPDWRASHLTFSFTVTRKEDGIRGLVCQS
jgi:hypothetical protein